MVCQEVKAIKIPELLAPAGGAEQLKAAVQNGADAVYMGGPLFNARIKAENFTEKNMKEAVDYAHERGVRVYVTVNTLLKDDELLKGFSYINFLYEAGADGVILQDMGLARLVRRYLPSMAMHLSTQATVYNWRGAVAAASMGFSRIVPARELTLHEIKGIVEKCHGIGGEGEDCQVEVFVHGAMCMCYSGQCQMSRALGGSGGRSGNRGLCAQPCRLPYEDKKGKKGYFLSPGDMCLLGHLRGLCEAGVDSLKIEGRMKSPQYVAVVTSIYRKYLDMWGEGRSLEPQEDDMKRLRQIFSRGGFTSGYIKGNPGPELLSGRSPKNSGIYAGSVKGTGKGSSLVDIEAEEKLSLGDGVEIINRETGEICGNVISYLKPVGKGIIRIGDIRGRISRGDPVYKVTDKALIKEAEASYRDDFRRKIPVNIRFTGKKGSPPILVMEEAEPEIPGKGKSVSVTGRLPVEKAERKPWDRENTEARLRKLGGTIFEGKNVEVDIDRDATAPVAVINEMRREAAERLAEKRKGSRRKGLTEEDINSIAEKEGLGREKIEAEEKGYAVYVYSRKAYTALRAGDLTEGRLTGRPLKEGETLKVFLPLEIYMEDDFQAVNSSLWKASETGRVEIIPYLLNITNGGLDRYLEENLERVADRVRSAGIAVGNPGWIDEFRERGVKVWGDYGLNVLNRQSEKAFEEMGVTVAAFSHDADWFYSGDIPLMITEHPLTRRRFKDRKGEGYTVMEWYEKDKYLIFRDGEKRKREPLGEGKRMIYMK